LIGCEQNENSERILTEADFEFLERGMSLDEVIAVVGPVSGTTGSGFISPFYELDNGRVILIFNSSLSMDSESLSHIVIENFEDGSRRTIVPE